MLQGRVMSLRQVVAEQLEIVAKACHGDFQRAVVVGAHEIPAMGRLVDVRQFAEDWQPVAQAAPIRSADLEQGLPYRARGNLGNLDETEIMFPEMPQLWPGTLDLVSLANIQEGAAEVHGRSGRRAFILVASDYTCKTARVSIGQGTDGAGATPALPRLLDGKEAHEARVGNGLADANSRLRW